MLTASLIAAAVLAGLAGAWSPCGFSMVETIAPSACGGRVRGTIAAAAAFAAGALAGGVVTFGGLALAGQELGLGGGVAVGVAAAALLAAAAGDAGGRRIVPQVRRQVPESWRRRLPLPLASGLYGVLLGLGFTTFVLSFATYALAAVCLALGDPAVGVAVGIAFAAGRAVPVLLLAPCVERSHGERIATAMAERPDVLRLLRAGAALALLAGVAVLTLDGPGAALAAAAVVRTSRFSLNATDPAAGATVTVWQEPGAGGRMLRDGSTHSLPGDSPAAGGGLVAWRSNGRIDVAAAGTLEVRRSVSAPAADEIAVSDEWLAWRETDTQSGRHRILLTDLRSDRGPQVAFAAGPQGRLGRPALEGSRLAFHLVTRRSSRIVEIDIPTASRRQLVARRGTQLLQPSLRGDAIAFVRTTARRQELIVTSRRGRREQSVWSTEPTARRDAGFEPGKHRHRAGYPRGRPPRLWRRPAPGYVATLWTTALSDDTAYVTRLVHQRGGVASAEIIAVALEPPVEDRRRQERWVRR